MGLPTLLRKRAFSLGLILFCAFFIIAQIHTIQKPYNLAVNDEQLRRLIDACKSRAKTSLQESHGADEFGAIKNFTLGFQKILVLGLPDRLDKKDVWSLATIASNLQIEWIEGIRGEDITLKARPAGWGARLNIPFASQTANSTLGSFRGHLNAIRRIIDDRISTALVLEDDVEWDVMIRQQLLQFAHGARYIQEVADTSSLHSPYGDDWDLLLIGHCAARSRSDTDGRYWVAHQDPTVTPNWKYKWAIPSQPLFPDISPLELQGNFTRLIFQPRGTRCAYGYAMSLRGAQKFLYHFSIEPRAKMMDFAVSEFCSFPNIAAKCITAFPNLIDQYKPAGPTIKDSDRRDREGEVQMREHGTADNIVFPLKAGLRSYIDSSALYESQWPDDSLWPRIDPATDELPIGEGFFLTKDKFKRHN